MNVMVLWFLTLIASTFIGLLFIAGYLDQKYREQMRRWRRDKQALEESNSYWQDQAREAHRRYRTLRAETMKGQDDEM